MSTFDEDSLSEDPQTRARQLQAFAAPAKPSATDESGAPTRAVQGPPPRRATPVIVPNVVEPTLARVSALVESAALPDAPAAAHQQSLDTVLDDGGASGEHTSSSRYGGRPSRESKFGRKVGNKRQIGLYLARDVREALERRREASHEPRGAILLEAFRSGYRFLLTEYEQVFDDDPLFGSPVRSARQVEDGAMVAFYVPDAQVESIVRIAERLGVSVSEAGSMALALLLLGPDSLNN
ncbi:MAG: hypothetical protein ACYC19_08835 [Acidimicrobiales bacterium]